jgi:hypothetical protein
MHDEIKSRADVGNACRLVQSFLSCSLISKNIKINIYKTIILPVVLHECEISSLTCRALHKLRVFKNIVLRNKSWPHKKEVREDRKKLHSEELRGSYFTPNIIRMVQ